jgi:hypothetical protein
VEKALLQSWMVTTGHLKKARRLLPLEARESQEESLALFDEYLGHNELELALDELVGLGEKKHCPAGYWQELIAAAENMGLSARAEELRAKSIES